MKTSQSLWFSDVFRGYRCGTLVENGLRIPSTNSCPYRHRYVRHTVAAGEYSKSFSESDRSAYQECQVTGDFNYPSEDYTEYISTDLSAETMSTKNDDQNSG